MVYHLLGIAAHERNLEPFFSKTTLTGSCARSDSA